MNLNDINLITLIWLSIPFMLGFTIYLIPQLDRWLAVVIAIVSASYAALFLSGFQPSATLRLIDHFGVSLILDPLASLFILTNAIVTLAVVLYCWHTNKSKFFYAQVAILHGSLNAAFISSDFVSLYVALEVISITSFLLIAYTRTDRSLWVALRYLFISNVAMLFYLIGAVLVYQTHHSFDFSGLKGAPVEAISLIFLGLLVKGGVFVSGLWLPLTHAESETPVSALMSGIVVKAGIFPLVRCALLLEEINPVVRIFGVLTTLLGVFCAVLEKDTKRMLAFHTVSQLGFILANPIVGGLYALMHGIVKSALFLIVGNLPSRDFKVLRQQGIHQSTWIALTIASLSISGMPLLAGFGTKVLTMKGLLPWQDLPTNIAALGTSISFAKFIFLPHSDLKEENKNPGFGWALMLLISALIVGNWMDLSVYTVENALKACITIALGWTLYFLIIPRLSIRLPRILENFEHLIGVMSLSLVVLFWMVFV